MVTTKASSTPTGDRRVHRTHAALQRALIDLVEEQDLSQLNIADVTDRAGVNRSTFYDHYRDVHELAEAACTAMIDELIESLPALGPDPTAESQDPTRSLRAFFANLAEHAGLYRSLLGPHGSARVIDHIRRRIIAAIHTAVDQTGIGDVPPRPTDRSANSPHDAPAAFTAGALVGLASDWLQHGCPQTPDQMAAVTGPLLAAIHQTPSAHPARCSCPIHSCQNTGRGRHN